MSKGARMEKGNATPLMSDDIRTEHVKYHRVAMGGKIYSLRMAKRMSQEQLAAVIRISPAAISKWERNV